MITKRTLPLMRLEKGREHGFEYTPNADEIAAMRAVLDLRKLRIDAITGTVAPDPRGLFLRAQLKGRATQNCVISGAPVQNDLDLRIERIFEAEPDVLPQDLTLDEDFDDRVEALPQSYDLNEMAVESIALALPDYPRLKKYETKAPQQFETAPKHTSPDESPEEEEKTNPFASLKTMLEEKNGAKS